MLRLSLSSPRRRLLALAVGAGVLGGCALGILRWLEVTRARSAWDRPRLERAGRLAGDDAAIQHRLGQWQQFSLLEGDFDRALRHYRRATELNPYQSDYWLDLADAQLFAGDSAAAATALERALQVDPRTPRTLWRAGNFWLRAGEPARAFAYFRQVLLADPRLAPLIVQVSHRTLRDPDLILRDVLPPRPEFLIVYLRQLVRDGPSESPAAARVWEKLAALGQPFAAEGVLFYVDFLIATRQLPQAMRVWNDLKNLRLLPADPDAALADIELLHNPGLRTPILNGGFDWRVEPSPAVSVGLGAGRQGERPPAVFIRFLGQENLHYRHFFQYVPAQPNRRYRLQAWVSTEGITTESGPRLEIADADHPLLASARSPVLVGTTDWVRQEVDFATGPETRLLRVGIVRLPSRRLDNKVRGLVRASEFTLRELGTASGRGAQP